MTFNQEQTKALTGPLDGRVVRERMRNGQSLSYVEGWYVIAEANRVFGFAGWDREVLNVRCVWEGMRQGPSWMRLPSSGADPGKGRGDAHHA